MPFVLDTDVCVGAIRGREPAYSRVRACAPSELFVASMTEAELRFGALNGRNPGAAIAAVEAFLSSPITVLPFDRAAARHHAELRYTLRAQRIGERDFVIASVALAHGLTLATGNVREFTRVPGLAVENWLAV